MANIKTVIIKNKIYSLREFAEKFDLSYTTVRRYYKQGYRNQSLLSVVSQKKRTSVVLNGVEYDNAFQASKRLKIPKSTFYRHLNNNKALQTSN